VTQASADFEQLYRRYAPGAFRRARRVLGSDADAHEAVQDLFVSLLEHPDRCRELGSVSAFMYRAITNACLNRLRNQRNRLRLAYDNARADSDATPRTELEARVILTSELARLPEPLAQVAVYYHIDGLTHDEIANILGCSRRHVGNLLSKLDGWFSEAEQRTCSG
jgi:RNA polymerase sigma factor (sigma-70 family)